MSRLSWSRTWLPEKRWARSFRVDAAGTLFCLASMLDDEAGCVVFREGTVEGWQPVEDFDEGLSGGFGETDDGALFFATKANRIWALEGQRWRPRELPYETHVSSMWGRSRDDFYLTGGGVVAHFEAGTWHDLTPPEHEFQGMGANYMGVHGVAGEVWVAGTLGTHSVVMRRAGDGWKDEGCAAPTLGNLRLRPGPEALAGGGQGAWHYAPAAGWRRLLDRHSSGITPGLTYYEALGWWRSRPLTLVSMYGAEASVGLWWGRERISLQDATGSPFCPAALLAGGRLVFGTGSIIWETQLPPL
jgi:hypothetical protein